MPRFVSTTKPGWFGLGRTRDSAGDRPGREAGVDDATCTELVRAVLGMVAPCYQRGIVAMVERIGSQVPGSDRVRAYQGRHKAAAAGVALPPWWRLRLAKRRTDAYQTAQDGPGSTPASPG